MLQEFDATNKTHVQWLKNLIDAKVEDKIKILNENPMNKEVPAFEVIQIMFALSMKYTRAVFNKTAAFI